MIPKQRTEKEALKLAETVLKRKQVADSSKGFVKRQTKPTDYKKNGIVSAEKLLAHAMKRRIAHKKALRTNKRYNGKADLQLPASQAPVLVAVRNNRSQCPKPIRRLLEKHRLTTFHYATILDNSPEVMADLKILSSFVSFGPITIDTLRELLTKHGQVKTETSAVTRLSSNLVVEEFFASLNALCIEDLVTILAQRQSGCDEIRRILMPMQLENATKTDGVAPALRQGWHDDFDSLLRRIM